MTTVIMSNEEVLKAICGNCNKEVKSCSVCKSDIVSLINYGYFYGIICDKGTSHYCCTCDSGKQVDKR